MDDSVVRGTTAGEIVQMARDAGALKVYFASAAPAIRYPNIYGIDIPTRNELIAYEREEKEIAAHIGCDWIEYQDCDDLEDAVRSLAAPDRPLKMFDTSCFTGTYVTGQKIGDEYFGRLHKLRNDSAQELRRSGAVPSKPEIPEETITPSGGDEGCESMHNDKRDVVTDAKKGCEAI